MPASAGVFICGRYSIVTLNLSFTSRAPRQLIRSAAALLALACTLAFAQEEPQMNLPRVNVGAGMYQIDSQVAFTPEQRQIGLMFRKEMPAHEGMLFVFEQPSTQCFWMKNTILPLSAAFVADDGSIVNIVDMKPQTTDSHCSLKPVRFVLEVNQGWFAKRKIQAGFKLTGKPFEAGK
ncbi:MAG: DUF192 domain-containing protein [Burkholderiaceae bacterium]|nr:DUF192 domain-containing protein [Burkholderiaceae bacterium]